MTKPENCMTTYEFLNEKRSNFINFLRQLTKNNLINMDSEINQLNNISLESFLTGFEYYFKKDLHNLDFVISDYVKKYNIDKSNLSDVDLSKIKRYILLFCGELK